MIQPDSAFSKNFGFSLGLRGDDRNNLASQETRKITAFYNLNDEWRLRANWGVGFKLPTIFQSTFFCCGAEKPNENLLPENSEGYEIGIDYRSNENFILAPLEIKRARKRLFFSFLLSV